MKIGIFSDDGAGAGTARLLSWGLAAGRPRSPSGADVQAGMGDRETDTVTAMPLSALRDPTCRMGLDVALTIGRDHPASARALRAARFDDLAPMSGQDAGHGLGSPPWFLPCSHQADLRTRASLAATGALRLPFATRAVPYMVPRAALDPAAASADGELQFPLRQTALLLAALAVAIGADPHVHGIGPGTVASLATARGDVRARATSDRLLALTAAFEALTEGSSRAGPARPSFRPCGRRFTTATCIGRDARGGTDVPPRSPRVRAR